MMLLCLTGDELPDGGLLISANTTDVLDALIEDLVRAYPGARVDDLSEAGDAD